MAGGERGAAAIVAGIFGRMMLDFAALDPGQR
jgi:hypothetical protein